jgi:hypothetical protein
VGVGLRMWEVLEIYEVCIDIYPAFVVFFSKCALRKHSISPPPPQTPAEKALDGILRTQAFQPSKSNKFGPCFDRPSQKNMYICSKYFTDKLINKVRIFQKKPITSV